MSTAYYGGDDQQPDFFFNDEDFNLDSLFNDELNSYDDHRYLPPRPNTPHTDSFQSSTSEISDQLAISRESVAETHLPQFPPPQNWFQAHHQDAAHNLNASTMQQPSNLTVDNPGTTLHLLTPSQLGPQAHHQGNSHAHPGYDPYNCHPQISPRAESFDAGEGSETRGNFVSPQDDHRQVLPLANDPSLDSDQPNIGYYITKFPQPIPAMDGVSSLPHQFKDEPKPLGEPLPPPDNRSHRASKKSHRFLFHPYSHQAGGHEASAAAGCTS